MPRYIVTDTAINVICGTYEAPNAAAALNAAVQPMGWTSYAQYCAASVAALDRTAQETGWEDYADYIARTGHARSPYHTLQAHAVEAISRAA